MLWDWVVEKFKSMPKRTQISVRPETYAKIRDYCKQNDIPMRQLMDAFIEEGLSKARLAQIRELHGGGKP